jgi:hypothetical protein
MKKLCLIGAFLFSIFTAQNVFAQCGGPDCCGAPPCGGPCGADCGSPCDSRTGECYCRYVHYVACPYTIKRCVQEACPYTVRCCRYVPQYYPIQRCRMVPEYYTVTGCRYCPEYYCVEKCAYVNRTICEPACTYRPVYYWRQECQSCCDQAPCCS